MSAPAASWCDPAGESPVQVRSSVRLVVRNSWRETYKSCCRGSHCPVRSNFSAPNRAATPAHFVSGW